MGDVIEFVELTPLRYGSWSCEPTPFRMNNQTYLHGTCDCGTQRPVRKAKLESGDTRSCGCKRGENVMLAAGNLPRTRPVAHYVMLIDGSNIGTRWAKDDPDTVNPWFPSVKDPPDEAKAMTRQEAEVWVLQRIKYRTLQGRRYGRMIIREL